MSIASKRIGARRHDGSAPASAHGLHPLRRLATRLTTIVSAVAAAITAAHHAHVPY